jgi:hypothetical protein
MEYRGKSYAIIQGIGPNSWRWTVQLDEGTDKTGLAKTRAKAVNFAVKTIDRALAPKKVALTPPED